jgi:ADP-ribose pyrophosphatase YjhB (NUDIX family)
MTLGVRGVACDAEGRVLLVRHTYMSGWHLPGGGVERGETCEHAMRKEFAEEAGLRVEPGALTLASIHLNRSFAGDHVLVYRAAAWTPCPPDSAGEIAERGFFAPDRLPEGTRPHVRARLAEILHGAAVDPFW